MTRQEMIDNVKAILNDIESEIDCRAGQAFDGELYDAIGYTDNLVELLESLNNDEYQLEDENEND